MSKYVGKWIQLNELNRDIRVGDLVMVETLKSVIVVEVSYIKDGELWHSNDWIIPREQILAIKKFRKDK